MRISVQRLRSLLSEAIDASSLPEPIPCPQEVQDVMEIFASEINGEMYPDIPRHLTDWFYENWRDEGDDVDVVAELEDFVEGKYGACAVHNTNGYRLLVWDTTRGVIVCEPSPPYEPATYPGIPKDPKPNGYSDAYDVTLEELMLKVIELSTR